MTDRPILFGGPMVRALIARQKTQTRRLLTPAYLRRFDGVGASWRPSPQQVTEALTEALDFRRMGGTDVFTWSGKAYPHQAPAERTTWFAHVRPEIGDRLYVREAWQTVADRDLQAPRDMPADETEVSYIADGQALAGRFRQGMHMPRWASRLTLAVTDIRIQRLQDISGDDAIAEGISEFFRGPDRLNWPAARASHILEAVTAQFGSLSGGYGDLMDHLHGEGFWASNPWVIVISFSVHKRNIDDLARVAA